MSRLPVYLLKASIYNWGDSFLESGMPKRRSDKWRRFYAKHPFCCFCGGGTRSATIDHVPGRGLLLNRNWPDGYAFPACARCNNESSRDEALIAWLVRVRLTGYSDQSEMDFRRALRNVRRQAPDVSRQIRFHSRVQTRRLLAQQGLSAADLGQEIVHMIVVPDELLEAARRYGLKIAKALHYLHTETIVPTDAPIRVRVFTNAETSGATYLQTFLRIATGEPTIRSGDVSLVDQFNYRYVTIAEGAASAFWVQFSDSISIALMISADPDRLDRLRAEEAQSKAGHMS